MLILDFYFINKLKISKRFDKISMNTAAINRDRANYVYRYTALLKLTHIIYATSNQSVQLTCLRIVKPYICYLCFDDLHCVYPNSSNKHCANFSCMIALNWYKLSPIALNSMQYLRFVVCNFDRSSDYLQHSTSKRFCCTHPIYTCIFIYKYHWVQFILRCSIRIIKTRAAPMAFMALWMHKGYVYVFYIWRSRSLVVPIYRI